MALLDSSAIAIILKRLGAGAVEVLRGKATLDLAGYELGNVIWKECALSGAITPEEAADRAEGMARLLLIMERLRTDSPEDLRGAMGLATGLRTTFYDSAYLHHARGRQPLVTEDGQLRERAAEANIRAITVSELLEAQPEREE